MSAQDGALREALERPIDYMTKDDMRAAIKALRAQHDSLVAHWCRDGETLADRLQRERDDSLALMGLLATEKQRAKDAEDRHAEVLAAVRGVFARLSAPRWSEAHSLCTCGHTLLIHAYQSPYRCNVEACACAAWSHRMLHGWEQPPYIPDALLPEGPEGGER